MLYSHQFISHVTDTVCFKMNYFFVVNSCCLSARGAPACTYSSFGQCHNLHNLFQQPLQHVFLSSAELSIHSGPLNLLIFMSNDRHCRLTLHHTPHLAIPLFHLQSVDTERLDSSAHSLALHSFLVCLLFLLHVL